MKPAFKEVAETDSSWVSFFMASETSPGLDSFVQQYHLSRGLEHIKRFFDANTFEKRRAVLTGSHNQQSHFSFMSNIMREAHEYDDISITLNQMNTDDEAELVRRPWYAEEPDTGPEKVWRWALADQDSSAFEFGLPQGPAREWAYVLWDHERLEEWGAFAKPFKFMNKQECEDLWERQKQDEHLALEQVAHTLKLPVWD
ncbi:uncharacterized protein ASPGLDRAFT_1294296 [Aspergillus glaucus CBS 516.65]|uniref:Uncharacterized protein n=1 Tax=Aspergillus glaucus CBS 516.65 TaxID=1160497 RepID=A0A1L9VPU5_ASPGL|nr:hypothetical protein ASPGLDRAFT_1294296 [Aspergillus glaucus CBS 516.65]OJJ85943.1 hypothetical protein ASPGLDRAFT_1294296 [Aspergillus glaucus CBS 516.65]